MPAPRREWRESMNRSGLSSGTPCCHAVAPPSSVMNSRLFTRSPRRRARAVSGVRREGIRGTDVTGCLAGSRESVRLDVRRSDYLAPLLGFFGNERPEIARRATEDNAAQVGELSLQLGISEASIDLLVELVD